MEECPRCDGKAYLNSEKKEYVVHDKTILMDSYFYKCNKCGMEFTTTELDDEWLEELYYLEQHQK
jgi:uncharacterized C2H2 Zn-finger protein